MAETEGGVFSDIFPAEWAADPDFCIYLSELSGYPLSTLKKEPERLAEARENNQKQETSFGICSFLRNLFGRRFFSLTFFLYRITAMGLTFFI